MLTIALEISYKSNDDKTNLFSEMSQLRNTLPALLSIGIGYCGYRIVYKVKHADPVQIDDGITVIKPWKVFSSCLCYCHLRLLSSVTARTSYYLVGL